MSEDILVPRHWAFAFLFPGQPPIDKGQILNFYAAVTKAKVVEVPEIRISDTEAVFGNQRPGGVGQYFQIQVGHHQNHFRLLIAEALPSTSVDCFAQQVDFIWDAFHAIWPFGKLILAEATLRYMGTSPKEKAIDFLAQEMGLNSDRIGRLSRNPELLGIRIGLPVEYSPRKSIALQGASANIRIENLLEDPRRLYFEMTCTWPAFPLPDLPGQMDLPREINAVPQKPSVYLEEAAQFLRKQVCAFTGLRKD